MQSQVQFNRVSEKFPEKVWEALVQSQVKFNRVPEKVPREGVQSQVTFNRVLEKVPEKVAEKIPEEVLGIFGAGPGQVQRVPEKVA